MAHHLAELIETAERSEGSERQSAENRAVDLILKLWTNRRALPTPADPLAGYGPAIKVLASMVPGADPWRVYGRRETSDDLLREMYAALVHLVMSGLLLTRGPEMRAIDDAEWQALTDEERQLVAFFERWRAFFATPVPNKADLKGLYEKLINGDFESLEDEPAPSRRSEEVSIDLEGERRAILSHVEVFQERLDKLVEKWRETLADDIAGETDKRSDDA
ncbi:hypothetical protein [Sphingomonas xinjiangensis]|uniref:Uncharacterized protein n=1 Tax=Sphingomonas xinjiangensis TaxID=643568 RepID=A0A840YSE8_9SPHN|nr:hypothetical protein [Sphingomonas xinjiangensis]MBB5712597.1 hypothetical protein [Sphingomonas xinjiangensis]